MRNAIVSVMLIALQAGWAGADVVTQRWGVSGHVQHPRTLKYKLLGRQGRLMNFDLSALPKGASIYRARLVFARTSGGYDRAFEIYPVLARDDDGVKPGPKPLALAEPQGRWFDATDEVRRQLGTGGRTVTLLIRSAPRYKREATFLEIAHEGKLKGPPPQVSAVRAFYRAGQVFITFKEVEDLSEGQERYPWGLLIKKLRGYNAEGPIPDDTKRELRYRVYRHDKPITAKTIGRAELLAEVVPASGFDTRLVRRIWRGENVPSKLDDKFIALRVAVEDGKPLASGVGVCVHTVPKAGRGYYAVVTSVNGVENTVDISKANTAGPIDEKVAPPEPVLVREITHKGKSADQTWLEQWYSYWAVPPLSPRPLRYDVVVEHCPGRLAKPAPLHVSHGSGWSTCPDGGRGHPGRGVHLKPCEDQPSSFWMGINEAHSTLRGIEHGKWQPFPQRRQEALIRWVKSKWPIDEQRITAGTAAWGMMEIERVDLYAYVVGWGVPEISKGFQAWQRARGVWGQPRAYKGRPDAENPFFRQDYSRYVLTHPKRELPYFLVTPATGAHNTEMGWPPFPRFFRAMMQTKRAFVASWGKGSWAWSVTPVLRDVRSGKLDIKRDQTLPAFANCTLDDNPGCGDLREGDYRGQINGYLLWETASIVDEPARWEMTVWVDKSAPLPDCTVDLTPRRCRKFRLPAGADFKWENLDKDGKVLAKGTGKADKHGLATVAKLKITKARHCIRIHR